MWEAATGAKVCYVPNLEEAFETHWKAIGFTIFKIPATHVTYYKKDAKRVRSYTSKTLRITNASL